MKNSIFIFLIFLCDIGFSQNYNVNMEIKTEQVAHYPAGDTEFSMYIFKHLKYSDEAKLDNLRGNVMVSFDVDVDSTISNISFLTTVGYGVEDSIRKIITPLKFAPKIMNGKKFKSDVMYTFPILAH